MRNPSDPDPYYQAEIGRVERMLRVLDDAGLRVPVHVFVFLAIARGKAYVELSEEGLPQAGIAKSLDLNKGTASKAVSKLVQGGLIREETGDGYRRLDLTLKGDRAVRRVLSAYTGNQVPEFGGFV